jgi:perosamine synthetase
MRELEQYFRQKGVAMIEDAAEGFGGDEQGRPFGSFGEMSVLSFYGNKLITTGEGGMVLTNDDHLYSRLCALRNLFFDAERRFIHAELCGNHRMSGCQASLGLSQIKRINLFLEHRRTLYSLYLDLLNDITDSVNFQCIPDSIRSSCWVFPIFLKESVPMDASQFISAAKSMGIEMRNFFYPLDRQPFVAKKLSASSEVSYLLSKRGLYLPLGNGISIVEVHRVADVVKTLLYSFK